MRRGGGDAPPPARGLLLLMLACASAFPARADDTETAATCAAFWLARDDFARRSPYLPQDPDDAARADAFRSLALRLGTDASTLDAAIAEQRPGLLLMFRFYIENGDRMSAELHDRTALRCEAFLAANN